MPVGYWCPVLHAHLPYVRHPEHPEFLEEDWFFEALNETYVPIVSVLDGLLAEGVEYRLTMTLSPPLVSMMTDELLLSRYHRHLDRLVDLAHREVERTRREDQRFHDVARYYVYELERIRRIFREQYGSNLLNAFRKHRDAGKLEIITCGATHGFLPLMDPVPQAVRAQVQVAARHYRKHFDRDPTGIWLPECGYLPGHETYLREVGLRFSFLEAHGLTDAHPRPSAGVHAPIASPGGIAFFGRDMESSRQVWSAETGYPGNYLFNRQRQVEHLAGVLGRPPIVVSPYDAELFGHWWFEGPDFLNYLFRKMHFDQEVVKPTTPTEFLERFPDLEVCQPPMCTWGAKGYAEVWLNEGNHWIYPHLDMAAERMVELARRFEHPSERERRALNQAARELLLAQSSDWAFIMKTNTTVEYAKKRTRDHIARFDYLYRMLSAGGFLEEPILREFEDRDNIFPDIDYQVYR